MKIWLMRLVIFMPRLAKQVTKDQILNAIHHIIENNIQFTGSTVHHLIYDRQTFPPIEVVHWAVRLAKIPNWESMSLSGGDDTNESLRKLGFEIPNKNLEN